MILEGGVDDFNNILNISSFMYVFIWLCQVLAVECGISFSTVVQSLSRV